MVESDENRFSIAVRGGDGELLFSSDDITSLEFDLSENKLIAVAGEVSGPVVINERGEDSDS